MRLEVSDRDRGAPRDAAPPTPPGIGVPTSAVREVALTRAKRRWRTERSEVHAHLFPPLVDSCWLGFRAHGTPKAIRSLPIPLAELHPCAPMRSPALAGCSVACRSRDHDLLASPLVRAFSPPFPAQPIRCSAFRPWSASLALPTSWPIMPSADFCPAFRLPLGCLSRLSDEPPKRHRTDLLG